MQEGARHALTAELAQVEADNEAARASNLAFWRRAFVLTVHAVAAGVRCLAGGGGVGACWAALEAGEGWAWPPGAQLEADAELPMGIDALLRCSVAVEGLRAHSRKGPSFEKITQLNEVAFEMIGDDFEKTRNQLNSIRARKTKFVCVNDDMKRYVGLRGL